MFLTRGCAGTVFGLRGARGEDVEVLWLAGPSNEDRLVARWLEAHGHGVTAPAVAHAAGADPYAFPLWVVDWVSLARARAAQSLVRSPDPRWPLLLLLLGAAEERELRAAIDAGIAEYLVRPLAADAVEARLALLVRRAEEAADTRAVDSSLESLIDCSLDPVSVHRDRVLVYVNPAAVKTLRFPSSEAVRGRSIYDFLPPEDHEEIERVIRGVEASGRRSELIEQRFVCWDGSTLVGEAYSFPAFYRGEWTIFSVGRDLTEVRRLESQVRHAERLATLGTMTAGIAHELNNPLSFVLANLADLCTNLPELADEAADRIEGLERRVDAARAGAERLRELTRELTRFASPREEPLASVDVQKTVFEAIRMAGPALRHVDVATEWAPMPRVKGNELRLVQIFLNLLINAAHAVEAKAPEARHVRIHGKTDREGRAVVEVVDTGVGIPPEVRHRIFEPFFTTKHPGGGTGLGLAVTRSIVRELGGDIEVESQMGVGTRMTVRLPPGEERRTAAGPAAKTGA